LCTRPRGFLEDHFRALGGRPAPRWTDARIGVGRAWTVDGIVKYSTHRNAIDRVAQAKAARTQREVARRAGEKIVLEAAGLTAPGRKRRPNGRRIYTNIAGRVVNDYVEPMNLRDEWDAERNGDLDPAVIKGSYSKPVWWVCRAHADGPGSHLHRWRAEVKQRATIQTGCPFCRNRELCAWNNLGFTRPDLAKLWDQDANGTVTPYDVLPGAPDEFMWRCERDPSHPSFPRRVSAVTGQGARCGLRHPKQTAERARTLDMVRGRMQRTLARQALPVRPGESEDTVVAPTSSPSQASGSAAAIAATVEAASMDLQGTFWDVAAFPPEPQLDLFGAA
jgi:hypothetical protein